MHLSLESHGISKGIPSIPNTLQGSYASGKCQGKFIFFKVRELSGNFMLCQGKMNVF